MANNYNEYGFDLGGTLPSQRTGGVGGSWSENLFKDPLLFSILAGNIGAGIKGNPLAEVGKSAADMAQGLKYSQAASKTQKENKRLIEMAIKSMGMGNTTMVGQPGVTTKEFKDDGTFTVKGNLDMKDLEEGTTAAPPSELPDFLKTLLGD